MTSDQGLELDGLDPQDPLGFLAALGCLAAVADCSARRSWKTPRLSFSMGPMPRPRLHSAIETIEQLIEVLMEDIDTVGGRVEGASRDPFLAFSYEDEKGKSVLDLKPPPEVFRAEAMKAASEADVGERRTIDWFSAVLTDVARDGSGASKPFALHFTAGQQRFLGIADELIDGVKKVPGVHAADLTNAVEGPWADDRPLKVFSWSPSQARSYALRASDPSADAKRGTPGADWLALRGVSLLSSAPVRDRIQTGGVRGGWKNGTFTYPIWPTPLDTDALRSLLRHPALGSQDARALRTWPTEIERWTCRISRSDQGGYGAFSRPRRE